MDQVKFAEDSFLNTWSDIVCLGRFKDCLPQILFDPILNTLTQIWVLAASFNHYEIFSLKKEKYKYKEQ